MACHQTKRGEGGKLERGRHRQSGLPEPRRSVETKRRLSVEKGLGSAATRSQRRQERACQDDVGGDHGDTWSPQAQNRHPVAVCFLGAPVDTRISGRSFRQAPPDSPSCVGRAELVIGWDARLTRPSLWGCNVPQRVVFHLKPQLLHLAQTPVENF